MRQLVLVVAAAIALAPRAALALQEDVRLSFDQLDREALKAGLADVGAAAGSPGDVHLPPGLGDEAESAIVPGEEEGSGPVPPLADSERAAPAADAGAGVGGPPPMSFASVDAHDSDYLPPAAAGDLLVPPDKPAANASATADAVLAGVQPDDPDANSTDPHQHRLREVARQRANRLKESQRSTGQRWISSSAGAGVGAHLPAALVVLAIMSCMTALSVYIVGPRTIREFLGLAPLQKMPGAHQSQSRGQGQHYVGSAIRRGISPVRSSLAPPWPHRTPRTRRITFDPTIHGLPSVDSLVGMLNAAPPHEEAKAQQPVFPPPRRWREGSPVRGGLDGGTVDVFVAPNMSEEQRQQGFTSSDAEVQGAAGLDMGAFGGTWGRLGPSPSSTSRSSPEPRSA